MRQRRRFLVKQLRLVPKSRHWESYCKFFLCRWLLVVVAVAVFFQDVGEMCFDPAGLLLINKVPEYLVDRFVVSPQLICVMLFKTCL